VLYDEPISSLLICSPTFYLVKLTSLWIRLELAFRKRLLKKSENIKLRSKGFLAIEEDVITVPPGAVSLNSPVVAAGSLKLCLVPLTSRCVTSHPFIELPLCYSPVLCCSCRASRTQCTGRDVSSSQLSPMHTNSKLTVYSTF
jgi:hypothetical protein